MKVDNSKGVDEARRMVQELQEGWAATDPDYPIILIYLQPLMHEIGDCHPPQSWPHLVLITYGALKEMLRDLSNRTIQCGPNSQVKTLH